jgi:hypothetical protein
MRNLSKFVFALLLGTASASAATIAITPLPPVLNPSDTFDVYIALRPDIGGEIFAFNIDLLFTADLQPGTLSELGFFAANGTFFSYNAGATSITGISDAASGAAGLTYDDYVVRIGFQYLGGGAAPPAVSIDGATTYLLDSSFTDIPFTIDGNLEAPVPEPASLALTAAALLAVYSWRRK